MALINCGLVLVVAITALFSFQVWNFRSQYKSDAVVLASIIAKNSVVALKTKDTRSGDEVVGSLTAQPDLVAAYLVMPDGFVLASFGKGDASTKNLSRFPKDREFTFLNGQMLYTQPVGLDRKRVGTVYLQFDY